MGRSQMVMLIYGYIAEGAIRFSDRDDLIVFLTGEGAVPASKSELGLDATRGVFASRVDVSQLPRDAVSVFLRHSVKREPVTQDLSPRSIAALIYLAELYKRDDLLKKISECLLRAAMKDSRGLCLAYVVASACNLDIRKQLVKRIASRFDQKVERNNSESSSIQCDLAIDSEKSLVFFIVDWTSSHQSTSEECAKLLSCSRRTFMSPTDIDAMSSYVEKFASAEMLIAWDEYQADTHLSVCWDSKHIAAKLPRCGMGKYRPTDSRPKRRQQPRTISWSVPLETHSAIPSNNLSVGGQNASRKNPYPSRNPPVARQPKSSAMKMALTRGLTKLRQKLSANSNK
ncbi:hypothetical protein Q1695_009561 [Nippostrongylus brasiliensis]|nr:hypothetical protein Q1695_009561 [Nippostrongylus brasiliensis]